MEKSLERKERGKNPANQLQYVDSRLTIPVLPLNRIPFTWAFDKVNKINNQKIAAGILKAAESLKFRNFIHLIDTDIYRSQYLKDMLHPILSIYYCRDFVVGVDYWKKMAVV